MKSGLSQTGAAGSLRAMVEAVNMEKTKMKVVEEEMTVLSDMRGNLSVS